MKDSCIVSYLSTYLSEIDFKIKMKSSGCFITNTFNISSSFSPSILKSKWQVLFIYPSLYSSLVMWYLKMFHNSWELGTLHSMDFALKTLYGTVPTKFGNFNTLNFWLKVETHFFNLTSTRIFKMLISWNASRFMSERLVRLINYFD